MTRPSKRAVLIGAGAWIALTAIVQFVARSDYAEHGVGPFLLGWLATYVPPAFAASAFGWHWNLDAVTPPGVLIFMFLFNGALAAFVVWAFLRVLVYLRSRHEPTA